MGTEPGILSEAPRPWIEIHDDTISSQELVNEVERRVERRRAEMGPVNLIFPIFGHVSTLPEPPPGGEGNPHLYYYLKQANQAPPPVVEPMLAPSPATRLPVVGRIWSAIRAEVHNLVLFYVNRSVKEQNQLNVNLVSTLNELTRTVQAQQAEIERLRSDIQHLQE